jgi:hypothetical protein
MLQTLVDMRTVGGMGRRYRPTPPNSYFVGYEPTPFRIYK